jgi:homoserine kinase type II
MGEKKELKRGCFVELGKYKDYPLIPATDGISDEVYLLGDEFVLKIFKNPTDEENILKLLKDLEVPKVVETLSIDGKKALIYTQIKGVSTKSYPLEVVKFLKKMHSLTRGKTTKNPKLFTKENLSIMIEKSRFKPFKKLFDSIDIRLNDDGIIHGDLFPDNAKFIGSKLSGVYDFSEACVGDFYFDLAVVTFSFDADVDEVLKSYDAKIKKDEFLEYIRFAKLYYAVSRYLHKKKDFREFFDETKV